MERYLTLKRIGETYKNQFGYPSRKVQFFDSYSKTSQVIFLHANQQLFRELWQSIEQYGLEWKSPGEIRNILINETLIRSLPNYKDCEILSFHPNGLFVVIKYPNLNDSGNERVALITQIYKYVRVKGKAFNPNETLEEEYFI